MTGLYPFAKNTVIEGQVTSVDVFCAVRRHARDISFEIDTQVCDSRPQLVVFQNANAANDANVSHVTC